jgi:hypothetical protein
MRHASRIDENQQEIVDALREAGASVYIVKLPVDLLVGYKGTTMLVEIKSKKTAYGRRGLNPNQVAFMRTWEGGAVALVDSTESALAMLKMIC